MKYSLEFRPAALKSLRRLPRKDLQRIKKKIDGLAEDLPDPSTTKMQGPNSFHNSRSGDYRIIDEIHDDRLVLLVVKIGHRKDVFKQLL
jgi:mRNA interferase RelE/StbE